jgi:hypothetical protein
MVEYRGRQLVIRYCEQLLAGSDPRRVPPSWNEAIHHVPAGKRNRLVAQMAARREYLANHGLLRVPDHWNTEGALPDGKQFYALKAGPLRAYGWYSSRYKGVFFVSHFAFKRGQKIAREDASRVIRNWRTQEEDRP